MLVFSIVALFCLIILLFIARLCFKMLHKLPKDGDDERLATLVLKYKLEPSTFA